MSGPGSGTGHGGGDAPTMRLVEAAEPGVGDEAQLRAAYAAHGGELYGHAFRCLADRQLAEEAVADTFVRAWQARDRFDPTKGSLRTWLFAIEQRLVIDAARARRRRPVAPLPDGPAEVGWHDDGIEQRLRSWQVEEAIRRIRPEHAGVLVEVYLRGRSGHEVAEELGIPEGTVRSRIYYGLRSMRLVLEEMGWGA